MSFVKIEPMDSLRFTPPDSIVSADKQFVNQYRAYCERMIHGRKRDQSYNGDEVEAELALQAAGFQGAAALPALEALIEGFEAMRDSSQDKKMRNLGLEMVPVPSNDPKKKKLLKPTPYGTVS